MRFRTLRTFAGVALVVTGLLLGSGAVAVLTGFPPTTLSSGAVEVQGAVASIEGGAGPPSSVPWNCQAPTVLSATCSTQTPSSIGDYPSPVSWVNLTGRTRGSPGPTFFGTMTWDASDGYVLLYGGAWDGLRSSNGAPFDWTYDNGVWTNISGLVTGGGPPSVLLPGLAFDPSLGKVMAFGGLGIESVLSNSTWLYHALVWTNVTSTAGPAPSPRAFAALAEDSSADEVLLFGGSICACSPHKFVNDTWTFKDGTWTNITASAGITSAHALWPAMANDPAESGAILIYGTNGTPAYTEDTLLFNGARWVNLTGSLGVEAPLAYLPEMAYDAQQSAVILFAFNVLSRATDNPIPFTVTFAFVGGDWVNLTGLVPLAPVYTSAWPELSELPDGTVGLYGGAAPGIGLVYDYFLDLASPPNVTRVLPVSTTVDAGAAIAFQFSVGGGVAPLACGYEFGDGGSDTGFESASHAYASPGPYEVTFTVTDLAGESATGWANLTVNSPLASSSISTPSTTFAPNTAVTMNVTASGGTPPYAYNWTFDDGSFSHAASPTHDWLNSGVYDLRVNVTDAGGGSVVRTLVLNVTSPSGTHSGLGSGLEYAYVVVAVLVVIATVAVVWLVVRRRRAPPVHPPVPITTEAPPEHPPPGAI
jgi:PKD repeat protein